MAAASPLTPHASLPRSKQSCSVAVVGAGAAGLAAARELLREGHTPVVFEQGSQPGGIWMYDERTDADPLGERDTRRRAHSSMYRGLRTNLPRELMGFGDFPFTPAGMAAAGAASADARRFPSHGEVLAYLRAFAARHDLERHVRFGARVTRAAPVWSSSSGQQEGNGVGTASDACGDGEPVVAGCGPRWAVTFEVEAEGGRVEQQQQEFDALIVCNGHYTATNLPDVAGADAFPGLEMHSHNYRTPEPFTGQTVVVVGASNSGEDLCREIADAADRVIICARTWKNAAWGADATPFGPRGNIERRGMVSRLTASGGAEFESGAAVGKVDTVVYATGYRYEFPFLEGTVLESVAAPRDGGAVVDLPLSGRPWPARLTTAGHHVAPLYAHMYFPPLAPSLAFIGLPWKVVPFPQFELQARLVARVLSGRAALPSRSAMAAEMDKFYAGLREAGVPPKWTHMMDVRQWEYNNWLITQAGCPQPLPAWRGDMYAATGRNKRAHPDDYRDHWDDTSSLEEAQEELAALVEGLRGSQEQGPAGSISSDADAANGTPAAISVCT